MAYKRNEKTEQAKAERIASLNNIKLYTLTEIEPILGVTHRSLQNYVADGSLKAVKIAGKWRVTEENLLKFLNGE